MPKTEELLHKLDRLREQTGVPRTIFAACPNSPTEEDTLYPTGAK